MLPLARQYQPSHGKILIIFFKFENNNGFAWITPVRINVLLVQPFPHQFCCTAPFNACLLFLCRFKDSQISIKNGDSYVIHENGTLEINVAQTVNSGKYTCIATNNLGLKENHMTLEVKGQLWTSHNSETGGSTLSLSKILL